MHFIFECFSLFSYVFDGLGKEHDLSRIKFEHIFLACIVLCKNFV